MSSMPWSIGPSSHPTSPLLPHRPLVPGDSMPRAAAVGDTAKGKGAEDALKLAHQQIEELKRRLAVEQIHCREALEHGPDLDDMVGRTPAMLRLHAQIAQVGATNATVLVQGETGTGKELVARAVHNCSQPPQGSPRHAQLRRAVADARRKRVVRARASSATGFIPTRRYAPSTEIEAWHATATDPAAGTRVKRPARVTLVVSTGPPKRLVPSLDDLDAAQIEQALRDAGFEPKIEEQAADDVEPGTVISVTPEPGSRVPLGSTVTIVVAREPEWETVAQVESTEDADEQTIVIPYRRPARARHRRHVAVR